MNVITVAIMIYFLILIFNEIKKTIFPKNKIRLFVDSIHSTIYVSAYKKVTDEELNEILQEYGDTYKIKFVKPNVVIKGINTYVVNFNKKKMK
ncbi:hypothetical protein QS426_11655 [Staphylococcus pseudintermedius]|uniref:hypothetical protein n=1 Tax=Staphylococcus pseudintermedius TaxID=283734 RepID=UPI001A0590FF|nr:hypothetical protein [Staphylococcus pseudintermedius]EGQ3902560.1 hypothetical protein [Staphylococcus pseudintermedius]EHP0513623.1 hypothetical protein [Staphylococcus pseudintermedius]EJG5860333.1 hypothetical protein [Staphylococcus pseudintermedius]ELJ9082701.1 hypothetical protein [Staphylococcus pseudintermedius]MCE5778139.1 hypothetical protein [Staphylococcus pseudintermedius]